MMTWHQANTLFQSARNKVKGKPIGRNTRIVEANGSYGIKLHNTIVLTIRRDGTYTYNTGGWYTVTTKKRMNDYGPARIHQHKHQWFINGEPYVNGVTVRADQMEAIRFE